jgi:hypothetical protein
MPVVMPVKPVEIGRLSATTDSDRPSCSLLLHFWSTGACSHRGRSAAWRRALGTLLQPNGWTLTPGRNADPDRRPAR